MREEEKKQNFCDFLARDVKKLDPETERLGALVVDVPVAQEIVLELKSVEMITPTHKQQVLSYLVDSNLKLGYVASFNVAVMKDGIKRIIRSF